MIRNGYYYPDWVWKNKPHVIESTGEFQGDCCFNMIVGNRRGGKSVGVGIFAIADFLLYGYKSVLIRRYDKHFSNSKAPAMQNFWKKCWNFREEFFEVVKSDEKLQEIYPLELIKKTDFVEHELEFRDCHALIDGEIFCYPVMLNKFDDNKNNEYVNVHNILYDEFIPETATSGLKDEFRAVANVFDTIARGRDHALETTGIVLMANAITNTNDFYTQFKVDRELRSDTKRLFRPERGWLLEVVHNEIAENEVRQSPFGKALASTVQGREYLGYSQGNITYDDNSFIDRLSGDLVYVLNLKYDKTTYALKLHEESGMYYLTDEGVDKDFKRLYAITRDDHGEGSILLSGLQKKALSGYKAYFDQGLFRFNSLRTKNSFLEIYSYL